MYFLWTGVSIISIVYFLGTGVSIISITIMYFLRTGVSIIVFIIIIYFLRTGVSIIGFITWSLRSYGSVSCQPERRARRREGGPSSEYNYLNYLEKLLFEFNLRI